MIIRLFDYKGQKEARQIIGDMPYVLDTEKKSGIVFFPYEQKMNFKYSSCNITEKKIDVYLCSKKK